MDKYIGTKLIEAEPAFKVDGKIVTELPLSTGDKIAQQGYKVKYSDGYISWSPKDVFEEAYRRIDNMNFGLAVEAVKKGFKVARKGWNDKNMFVYYVPGGDYTTQTEIAKKAFGGTAHYNPYLAIKTVSGNISTWVPSINDCLAEDWYIVE